MSRTLSVMMRSTRLVSLDAFRGLALVGMIFVNSPGANVWPQLQHSAWDGMTVADVVFPLFLFAVGAALAVGRPPGPGRVLRRVVTLAALGMALNFVAVPEPLRYPGVLQRIAVVYGLAAMIVRLPRWAVVAGVAALLVGYGGTWVVAGESAVGSAAGSIDVALFGRGHLYGQMDLDPEGVVSTVGALATCLTGYLTAAWLRSRPRSWRTVPGLVGAGLVIGVVGAAASGAVPLNKTMWTPTYVLVTAGIAVVLLAALYAVADLGSAVGRALVLPLVVLGANSLVIYLASELAEIGLRRIVTVDGSCTTGPCALVDAHVWLYTHAFVPWAGGRGGSLAFSAAFVAVLWLVAALMWRGRLLVSA